MRTPTNDQSLFEDDAREALAAAGVGSFDLSWTGSRFLTVTADPQSWPRLGRALDGLRGRAADRGYKIMLQGTG